MPARMRRRLGQLEGVRFCEPCGEVSTPASRAQARLERARTDAMYLAGFRR
jgi:hypothetical protein